PPSSPALYTLSLHDALPIFPILRQEAADRLLGGDVEAQRGLIEEQERRAMQQRVGELALHALAQRQLAHRLLQYVAELEQVDQLDRKSTRLNSSHVSISYAV